MIEAEDLKEFIMRKARILWAEDKPRTFDILSNMLVNYLKEKQVEPTIIRAADGNAVFGHLNDAIPDVLILDINMPDKDGITAVKGVARDYTGLPTIIVSAFTHEDQNEIILTQLLKDKVILGAYASDETEAWCEAIWRAITIKGPTILHMSDIHFGKHHALKNQLQIEDLITAVLEKICAKSDVDVVVISGDLSSVGEEREFNLAKDFLHTVAETLKLSLDRFVIVPGNHDIYQKEEPSRRFLKFAEFLNNFYGKLTNPSTALRRYIELYHDNTGYLRWDSQKHDDSSLYSITIFDELKMVFIGLNSVISIADERWKYAEIHPLQLKKYSERLQRLLKPQANYFRVAVFHHNLLVVPSFTCDGEPDRIVRNQSLVLHHLISNKVNLALHGHTHYSIGYQYSPYFLDRNLSPAKPIHVFAAGTLSGEELARAQSYFHLTAIRCSLNDQGSISSASLTPYELFDDSLEWEEGSSVSFSL